MSQRGIGLRKNPEAIARNKRLIAKLREAYQNYKRANPRQFEEDVYKLQDAETDWQVNYSKGAVDLTKSEQKTITDAHKAIEHYEQTGLHIDPLFETRYLKQSQEPIREERSVKSRTAADLYAQQKRYEAHKIQLTNEDVARRMVELERARVAAISSPPSITLPTLTLQTSTPNPAIVAEQLRQRQAEFNDRVHEIQVEDAEAKFIQLPEKVKADVIPERLDFDRDINIYKPLPARPVRRFPHTNKPLPATPARPVRTIPRRLPRNMINETGLMEPVPMETRIKLVPERLRIISPRFGPQSKLGRIDYETEPLKRNQSTITLVPKVGPSLGKPVVVKAKRIPVPAKTAAAKVKRIPVRAAKSVPASSKKIKRTRKVASAPVKRHCIKFKVGPSGKKRCAKYNQLSRWQKFLKEYAAKHKISYRDALRDKAVAAAYRKKYGLPLKK